MESQSILVSIKEMLDIADTENFDNQLISHINSSLSRLRTLGVGPKNGFSISSSSETWEDFIINDPPKFRMVREYIFIRSKLLFDPPTSGIVTNSYKEQLRELEFCLNDSGDYNE